MLLARHGQSLFNVDGVVNGDPAFDRGLSALGSDEARKLGRQVAGVALDLCIVSEFPRAQQTARLALEGREAISTQVDPELNAVQLVGTPEPEVTGEPKFVPSMTNCTLPVGAVVPEAGQTLAVNVTAWPKTEGLAEEVTVVSVPTALTVWPPAREPVLPANATPAGV